MVGMIVTYGQLGISSFEGIGAFGFNSRRNSFSPSGFPLRWRPSLGIYLNVNNRRLNFGTICKALSKGESNGKLIGVSLLEKDAEFRPSFNDYLKVMESVKTVRDKRQSNGFQKQKLIDKSRETGSSDGNEEGVKLEDLEEHSNQEKDLKGFKRDESLNSRDSFTDKNGKRRNITDPKSRIGRKEGNVIGKETRKSDGRDSMDRNWPKYQTGREEAELDENRLGRNVTYREGYKSTGNRIPSQVNDNNMDMRRGYEDKANSSQMWDKKRTSDHRLNYKSKGNVREREKNGIGFNKLHEKVGGNYVQDDSKGIVPRHDRQTKRTMDFGENFDDNNLNMERAAFRNLDEFGDIMEIPRLPRNVMEERIQKLANSLNGADVDMPEWMFSKMMRSARIRFTDHSILRVIQILGKFGNWRRVLQVIEWLQIRERFKSHKTRFIYTTALNVLGKVRRPVEALNVFNAMQQQISSYPDLVAYHSIAVTLGQAGHMKELFDVIDAMRSPPKKKFKTGALGEWDPRVEPDIVVYNAVLNACAQRKQWEGAFWVLQQLKEKSVQPTATTYGLIMEVMLACGKYNLVHDFFRKIQKSSTPNALTYRVLVNTLWKEGKLDEAVLAVQNMENRGIVGSASLYYDFARCLCSAGRCQEALAQVEKICKVANKPLVVTYTGLIQACLDSGNVEDGAYMFNHMKKFCSPNLVTCNIMLKAYLKHGMFKEGKELFQMMLEDGSGFRSKANHNVLVAPDIYTFNTLLDACVSEKRWDDFEYFYKKMLHRGYHFNSKRHLQMILEASRAGKGELLDITWNYLVEADRTPPASLIKERLCMKLEKEDYVAALSCIQNQGLLTALPDFSGKAWSRLFEGNSKKFQKGTLVRFVHEVSNIVARSDQPNPALDNLLESCKELTRTYAEGCVGPTQTYSRLQTDPALTI
ncbi:pentatricopeptide repeat-containing protein At1g30610, chloroplastic [Humulus lupulus]|uniref:pentatricopeptide repeat-containing protein At1g30610, chloroplastic n=1 Tax=Humulus lupulus TaxID=3486 RepID=UPI002B404E8A|nr:pentatricopeptide repeat-containing protein At1g30610, chloroplastic [Humulus lupulus]